MPKVFYVVTKNLPQINFDNYAKDKLLSSVEMIEHEITNTNDLYVVLTQHATMANKMAHVTNLVYNEDYLLQSIGTDSSDNYVLVKRKLLPSQQETYTFMDYDYRKNEGFDYSYLDVTDDDVFKTIRSNYIHTGVHVNINGLYEEYEYYMEVNINKYNQKKSPEFGTMVIKNKNDIIKLNFINFVNVVSNLKNKENLEKVISKYIEENPEISHLYTENNLDFGCMTILTNIKHPVRNELLSDFFKSDVMGDVYLGYEDNINGNNTTSDLTSQLFSRIIKNKHSNIYNGKKDEFFNIYRVLE